MPRLAPQPNAPAAVGYTMPKVEVGQIVLWSYGQGSPQSPAVVLSVGGRTMNLAVHVDGYADHVSKTGVRHFSDPFLLSSPQHDSGVWVLTPRDIKLNALLAANEPAEE